MEDLLIVSLANCESATGVRRMMSSPAAFVRIAGDGTFDMVPTAHIDKNDLLILIMCTYYVFSLWVYRLIKRYQWHLVSQEETITFVFRGVE